MPGFHRDDAAISWAPLREASGFPVFRVPYAHSTLPPTPQAPAEARRRVAKMCHGLSTPMVDTAQLLVSELVTNAFTHARGDIGLRISRRDGGLRVAVSDLSPRPSRLVPDAQPDDESGRGLFLLDALATTWGSAPHTGGAGKTVWFELSQPHPARQPIRRETHHCRESRGRPVVWTSSPEASEATPTLGEAAQQRPGATRLARGPSRCPTARSGAGTAPARGSAACGLVQDSSEHW